MDDGRAAPGRSAPSLPFADLAQVRDEELRPAERRVVQHLLGLDPAAPAATAGAVAHALGVSQATVVNAVQRLGYAGFGDFRRRLIAERAIAASLPAGDAAPAGPPASGDPLLDVCRRAMLEDVAAVELTAKVLDGGPVGAAARLLAEAPYVMCVGTEWSGVLARLAAGTFTKYGLRATGEELGVEQLSLIGVVDPRTVVLAISHRGRNEHLLEVIRRARARGLTVLALTHRATSPLARLASVVVVCTGLALLEGTHPNQTGGPATYLTLVRGLAEAVAWIRRQEASEGAGRAAQPDSAAGGVR